MTTNISPRPSGRLLDSESPSGVGVRNWTSILDDVTTQQALATARCAAIGSVIIPAAVGVDIGCGMVAALTDRTLDDLKDPQGVLGGIRQRVPGRVFLAPDSLARRGGMVGAEPRPARRSHRGVGGPRR